MERCRWMDGAFSDLNPDSLVIEVEDYGKDMFKLLKVFVNRYKKAQVQWDERERERKKNYRRKSTVVDAGNPELASLQVAEPPVTPPAAISVCERIIAQVNDFKVNFTLLLRFSESV